MSSLSNRRPRPAGRPPRGRAARRLALGFGLGLLGGWLYGLLRAPTVTPARGTATDRVGPSAEPAAGDHLDGGPDRVDLTDPPSATPPVVAAPTAATGPPAAGGRP